MNHARLFPDVFHDVDFAALGPAGGRDVVAQHPESRPHSLPCGDFDAGFEAAVGLGEQALGLETRRGVLARDVVRSCVLFLAGGDYQISVFDARVFSAIGVPLEFLIAPATAAEVVGPLFGVGERTVGAVELVVPHESVVFVCG